MKRLLVPALLCLLLAPLRAELTSTEANELRAKMRANFFIDPVPALDAKTHRHFKPAPGVAAEAVTYTSALGCEVPVILYLPDPLPKEKIPAFIVVNGHGGDKYSWYAYYSGIAYARAGAAVITYDPAGEGERSRTRKSGTREHDALVGSEEMARRLCGLMLTDIFQATSYLSSRPEVDPKRIAAGGYSMGSFVLAIAGAMEPRVHAVVLSGGGNLSGKGDYWDRSSKTMCQAQPWHSLDLLGPDRGGMIYALQADRGPTLIWNGRVDTVVEMPKTQEPFFEELRARAVKIRGTKENEFEFGFTDGGSHRPYFVTKPAAVWLEKQLHFPHWTEASVQAMPVTHISEWSAKTGVPVDKMYATEDREGGALAIGDGVPGIEREQLSVFTPAEWEKEKGKLMFDSWVEKARAVSKNP